MSDTMSRTPADTRLLLDDSQAASPGDPRELERELRVFHLRSPQGPTGGATPFVPATMWHDLADRAPGKWDPEPVRVACAALLGAAPEDDIPFADRETAALRLFLRAARVRSQERRQGFERRIQDLARRLGELLEIDRSKKDARAPERLAGSIGAGGSELLDTATLSNLLGRWRGPESLAPERRSRIENVLREMESFTWADEPHVIVVHDGSLTAPLPSVQGDWTMVTRPAPCADAVPVFEEAAARLSRIFRAVRVATLEVANRFDPARHGPWLEHLEPSAYSSDERQLAPIVVAWEDAGRITRGDFPSFTRFLLCDRPVHLVLHTAPVTPSPQGAGLELGYLAVAHRKAFVQQSSLGTPEHLLSGMLRGFDHMRPALHAVLTDPGKTGPAAAGFRAALHARLHPHFRYDPQAGTTWAGRMDFSGNPSPEEDWPEMTVECQRANGQDTRLTVSFTPADWALSQPDLAGEFRPVPVGCATEMLTALGTYLTLDADEAAERVPYVWGADDSGRLRRLALTRRLTLACRERLDFWHTLQELAGIRSEYVLEAVRRTRAEVEATAAKERARLAEVHAEELAQARREAVGDAMRALSNRLLELDLSAPLATSTATPTAPSVAAPAPASPSAAPSAAAVNGEAAVVSDEPWIDTPLCTSCNDCINVNSLLFKYDGNKQAVIGDATAGTFAQMVQAAEKCPARCIHPGTPGNPDEAGLEDLVRRAKPFR